MRPGGLPYIADEGRDGTDISHLIDLSEPGSWRDALQFALFRVEPYTAQQCVFDPAKGGDHPLIAFAPASILSTHETPDSPEVQQDHA